MWRADARRPRRADDAQQPVVDISDTQDDETKVQNPMESAEILMAKNTQEMEMHHVKLLFPQVWRDYEEKMVLYSQEKNHSLAGANYTLLNCRRKLSGWLTKLRAS